MAPPSLLGPPEIYAPTPTPQPKPQPTSTDDPFIDAMVANFNNFANKPPMGLTENQSLTFISSGNPCLDFFFHILPDTPSESLTKRLQLAWAHNSLTTLKLICNLRGVRGTGKSDKESFYTAALWLHRNHPKTLACNLAAFAEFGYFKDLPEIIYRILEGLEVRKNKKAEWLSRKKGFRVGGQCRHNKLSERSKKAESSEEKASIDKETASALRKDKKISMAKKVLDRYGRDPDFRFLYERVSDVFAECLKIDIGHLNSKEYNKISLAAKWCPSLDSSFDRSTLLCESIAKKVYTRDLYAEYEGIEEVHYAYRVRDRLRKEVIVPLRKVLELPEVYIGANQWNAIPYNRVASVAMKLYKDKFLKHDEERFEKYLEDVKSGKAKIAAGALLPHEIISSLSEESDDGQVAELQWKRMVDDFSKKGKLKNCIAVCDVSGSMMGIPMEISVALGLLVSEMSEEPWKGNVITFSEKPQLHLIEGDSLKSKAEFVRTMNWGMNTDFQKVFDLILQVAVDGDLKEEQMIKRVFVFSDMEFDRASPNNWETDYDVICRKFKEKGFGSAVPQIVFWNLRDSRATPVAGSQEGVALVSGFSKNLMTMFLDKDGEINPENVMKAAISGKEYQSLVVID